MFYRNYRAQNTVIAYITVKLNNEKYRVHMHIY